MILKSGDHFTKIKEIFLIKPKIFFVAPNTKKYKKYFLKFILCQNKLTPNS
jgi:hypothetical protein